MSVTRQSILKDLRRMGPVIGLVVATGFSVTVAMQWVAVRHLRASTSAHPNACRIADLHIASGERLLARLRTENSRIVAAGTQPPAETAGLLAGNAELLRCREELVRALDLCPARSDVAEMLSIVSWYAGEKAAARYYLGLRAEREERPAEAVIQYELALEADPAFERALIALPFAAKQAGDAPRALELVVKNLAMLERTAQGKLVAGRVLADVPGRQAEALELLRGGLITLTADEQAIRAAASLFGTLNRHEEGGDFFLRLGDDGRRTIPTAYHNGAILYRAAGNLTKEDEALRRALALFPNSAALNFDLAVNLDKRGRKSEARDFVKRSMECDRSYTIKRIADSGVDPGA